jgi:hypothetical protein
MALIEGKLKLSLLAAIQDFQPKKREPQNLRPAAHGFSANLTRLTAN